MPHLPPPIHTALREAVAARFGQPVRYPSHCDALEAELQKTAATNGRRLSPSTLRRFFGLVEKEGGYHLHTLDTLARYAGHADFAAFGHAVAGLTSAADATAALIDIPGLLGMQRLTYAERLLLGYFLGRVTRPASPLAPAVPLALRLAAHPAGQEFFVESFVDLAHLTGSYGEVLATYLRHKATPEAQLFGHSTLFLREFLAQDEPAWHTRLRHIRSLSVPPSTHPFPLGRRAFAELMAAWHERQPLATLLPKFRQEASGLSPSTAPTSALPAFYNLFPAGYHFFVAEALFLTAQFTDLLDWLADTRLAFPKLTTLEGNVYNELLRTFHTVALARTGHPTAQLPDWQALFTPETHSWLLDYYQVHFMLADLHIAATQGQPLEPWQARVNDFADAHQMPFYRHVAQLAAARQA